MILYAVVARAAGRSTALRYPGEGMSGFETSEWTEASRRYLRLRRLWWRCWFGGVALFALLGTPLFIFKQMNPQLQGAIGAVLGVGFLGCWGGCVLAWFGLVSLRCPRCGGR